MALFLFTTNGFLYRQIIDDGFKHSLIVYEDRETKGMRLHAAVWDGELRQCPVWTAFSMLSMLSPLQGTSLDHGDVKEFMILTVITSHPSMHLADMA